VLGFWFSGHPLEGYQDELKAFATPFKFLVTKKDRDPVTVGGVVTSISRKTSKNNDKPYLVVRIEDLEGSGEVIFMNGAFDDCKDQLAVDSMILVEGTVSARNDPPSVWANSIEDLTISREKRSKGITITLSTLDLTPHDLDTVIDACSKYPGNLPLSIRLSTETTGDYRVKCKKFTVSPDRHLIRELREMLGKENVALG